KAVLQDTADRQLEFIGARRLSYLLAFVQGDTTTMAHNLESSIGASETNAAYGWQADTSAFAGRVRTAHEQFSQGIQLALQGHFPEVAARLLVNDAENHATVGQCPEARSHVSKALELNHDNGTIEHASRALALCGGESEAMNLSNELQKQFPTATLTMR